METLLDSQQLKSLAVGSVFVVKNCTYFFDRGYLAPEILQGKYGLCFKHDACDMVARRYSLDCDMWSFGVCIYRVCTHFFLFSLNAFSPSPPPSFMHQLTTGLLPFEGESAAQVVERILHTPALPLGSSFSGALKMTITHMLEKVFFCLWGGVFFLFSGTGEEADSGRGAGSGGSAHIDPTTPPFRAREHKVDNTCGYVCASVCVIFHFTFFFHSTLLRFPFLSLPLLFP
jgi:serine/threonine protein kinase